MSEKNGPIEPDEILSSSPRSEWQVAYDELRSFGAQKSNPTAKKFIDWAMFKKHAALLMPLKDIAPLLGCTTETLNQHCKKEFKLTGKEAWDRWAAAGKRDINLLVQNHARKGSLKASLYLSDRFLRPEIDPYNMRLDETAEIEPREINYQPTIMGVENNSEGLKAIMLEFLDLTPQQKEHLGKNDEPEYSD